MRNLYRLTWLCCAFICLLSFTYPVAAQNDVPEPANPEQFAQDSLTPPPPPAGLAGLSVGPSQFMAGEVAVGLILAESNNQYEASTEDWTPAEIEAVTQQVQAALSWWETHVPLANLHFTLDVRVVATDYEPVNHGLNDEQVWIGNVLEHLEYQEGRSYTEGNYFDRAYAAAYDLRDHYATDWATLIFMANSQQKSSGRFNDNRFAYAYINGPFIVATSDVGSYGTSRMAPVITHEMGHIFGALDQYSQARVPCNRSSGYLNTPTTNSEYGDCVASSLPSIMIAPISAYENGDIDPAALHQIGYRDKDADGIIDPLDTTVELDLDPVPPSVAGERPRLSGSVRDIGFPSAAAYLPTTTINRIVRVEYRVDAGDWVAMNADEGTFGQSVATFSFEPPLYDGSHLVEVQAVNSVGNISAIQGTPVDISGIGMPPDYSISTPELSNTTEITITFSAPDTTQDVQISSSPSFPTATWQAYQPNMAINLGSCNDGPQSIYIRFRDTQGYTSPVFTQAIILDSQPPEGQIILEYSPAMRVLLNAEDQLSGVTEVEVQINDGEQLLQSAPDADQQATTWLPYQSEIDLPADTSRVRVRFRDAAGNVSAFIEAGRYMYLPLIIT